MVRQNSPKNASNIEKAADYSGYSKEDLLKLIDLEMAKPEKKIDGDLVDAYVKAALLKDQDTLPDYEAKMPQPGSRVIKLNSARRKRKKRAVIALAACISVLVVVFLTPISSYAFNFSIIDTLATWYRDKVTIKPGNMTSSQQEIYTNEEIQKELENKGITSLMLPHYETNLYMPTYYKINENEIGYEVSIHYTCDKKTIKYFAVQYKDKHKLTDINLHGMYPSGQEIRIQDKLYLWIQFKENNRIIFTNDATYYDINVPFDLETTKKMVETIY